MLKQIYVKERLSLAGTAVVRITAQFLGNDIQASGYWGCRTGDDNYPIYRLIEPQYIRKNKRTISYLPKDKRAVFGLRASAQNCLLAGMPESVCERVKDNSDLLAIYNVPQKIVPVEKEMLTPADPIHIKKNSGFIEQNLMLLSDARTAELFLATAVQYNQVSHDLRSTANLSFFSKPYGTDAKLAVIHNYVYYIGQPQRLKKAKKNNYALYRYCFEKNKSQELVCGINDFKVEYALLSQKGHPYFAAEKISQAEWHTVQSVRITIETEATHEKDKHHEIEFTIRNRPGLDLSYDSACSIGLACSRLTATEYYG
jgi:hypothetical protein